MTTPFNDIDVGEPSVLLQQRRGVGWLGLFAGLIMIAGVSGLLWSNYDRLIEASSSKAASANAAGMTETEPSPSLADFQALQQQTTQAWQSTSQLVEAQSADLKRLSDQVAALSARIEQLQQPAVAVAPSRPTETPRSAATTAARIPPAATSPTAMSSTATAPGPLRRQPAAPRAAAPRPSSTISVGGAPLPGTSPPPPIR